MAKIFETILCAVDLDETCSATIKTAYDFLPTDGRLYIYHAANFPYALVAREAAYPLSKAKERLEAIAHDCLGDAENFEIVVESSDDVAKSIVEAAQRLSVASIALATHSREGADRLFLGNIAERVVRAAPCPVLTIRRAATESSRTPGAGWRSCPG